MKVVCPNCKAEMECEGEGDLHAATLCPACGNPFVPGENLQWGTPTPKESADTDQASSEPKQGKGAMKVVCPNCKAEMDWEGELNDTADCPYCGEPFVPGENLMGARKHPKILRQDFPLEKKQLEEATPKPSSSEQSTKSVGCLLHGLALLSLVGSGITAFLLLWLPSISLLYCAITLELIAIALQLVVEHMSLLRTQVGLLTLLVKQEGSPR